MKLTGFVSSLQGDLVARPAVRDRHGIERVVPRDAGQHGRVDRVAPQVQAPARVVPGGPEVVHDRLGERRRSDLDRPHRARHGGAVRLGQRRPVGDRGPGREPGQVVGDRVGGRRAVGADRLPVAAGHAALERDLVRRALRVGEQPQQHAAAVVRVLARRVPGQHGRRHVHRARRAAARVARVVEHGRAVVDGRARVQPRHVVEHAVGRVVVGPDRLPAAAPAAGLERDLVERVAADVRPHLHPAVRRGGGLRLRQRDRRRALRPRDPAGQRVDHRGERRHGHVQAPLRVAAQRRGAVAVERGRTARAAPTSGSPRSAASPRC